MKSAAEVVTHRLSESVAREIAREWSEPAKTPQPESPIAHPAESAWQRKWLKLDCWHADVQRVATESERFAGRWFRNRDDVERLLVLSGHTGCGKTHAAKAVYQFARASAATAAEQAFWNWPASILFTEWPMLARQIVEAESSMHSLLADSMDADLLVIDDIGAESDKFKTGETVDALCQLLSQRAGKWTFVTTNIALESWTNRFDARVADRLCRSSRIVDLAMTGSYATR